MPILQRYILGELLRVFLFVVSALTVLLVFVGVFREISESGLGLVQVMQILPFIIPSMMPFTIPATLLLTVCVVYGRMSGDLEITAAKAAGINVLSLLWPALGLGVILSAGSLFLTDQVIPWAVGNIQRTVTMAMEDIFLDVLRTQHQVTNSQRGFSITVIGVDDRTLLMPTFQYTPKGEGKEPITIQAQEATMSFDLEAQQVNLHLVSGHIDIPGKRRAWFKEVNRVFPLPKEIQKPKPRHLSIAKIEKSQKKTAEELKKLTAQRNMSAALTLAMGDFERLLEPEVASFPWKRSVHERDLFRLNTEVHSRIAMSFGCICFVLIGAPFAILRGKNSFITTFFMCFLPILVVYYPVLLLMMNLSKTGRIDPTWSMWVCNGILLIWGARVMHKVLRC